MIKNHVLSVYLIVHRMKSGEQDFISTNFRYYRYCRKVQNYGN